MPVGGVNESAIVGNLEVEYRVNEDGTINLRVFNRENEINYIGEGGVGYTQGIGMSYEVDFDTFKEFVNKVFKKHQLGTEKDSNENDIPDSTVKPDIINLKEDENLLKDQEPKVNKDVVPNDND